MHSIIHKSEESSLNGHLIILGSPDSNLSEFELNAAELTYIQERTQKGKQSIQLTQ